MYNKVVLVGNLTRDIEIKYSQGGMAIAKSAIATSRKFKSNTGNPKEEVCFVDITFFGRSAEIANQYLYKGSKILVDGRLVFEQWTDQNGQKRSKHGVTVDIMQMLNSKSNNASIQNLQQEQKKNISQQTIHVNNKTTQNKQYNSSANIESKVMSEIDDMEEPFPF